MEMSHSTTTTPTAAVSVSWPWRASIAWMMLLFLLRNEAVASAFVVHPTRCRSTRSGAPCSSREYTRLHATDAVTVCKNELLSILRNAPSGRPTPRRMTTEILTIVSQLEGKCPTPEDDIVSKLAGSWELLWTAQDPNSETKNRWINPLENQAYSNNPEGNNNNNNSLGRSNPFLPVAIQNRLERAGIVSSSSSSTVRSTQAIDLKTGLIRNIVAVQLGNNNNNSIFPSSRNNKKLRRASITVTVRFAPSATDPRKINVKFDSCRVSLGGNNKLFPDWIIPLGPLGPTGWLQTVYLDDDFRVTRGHKGSVFVLSRPRRGSV